MLRVASHVGAWIETLAFIVSLSSLMSRPTWARGLKPPWWLVVAAILGRVPRGRVD